MSTENEFEFIEDGEPYVIAEVGGNHGGSVKKAKKYVTAAAESGADSVKFQLYQAENLILEDEPPLPLAGDSYNTQFERFKQLELTRSEWREIIQLCDSVGIDFSASVFDAELLKFAVDHMPFVKIASGDMTNIPLLRKVVKTGKPILLSTGFSSMDEIKCVMRKLSDANVIPLHCMGCYPTDEEDANLTMVEELSQTFGDPVGYSDHTVGTLTPVTAVSKGARVVEKHFTFDKSQELGDHRLSANVSEMKEFVEKAHRVYDLFGESRGNEIYSCEDKIRSNMRRSLAIKNAIQKGAKITEEDLTALRPSDGISPLRLDEIVGKTATRSIEPKTLLYESDIN
jgi:sialic acid synthase SpsE